MYGHVNHNDLILLQKKSMVEGLPVMKNDHIECEACALGKHHREEFPIHKEKKQSKILESIHKMYVDLCKLDHLVVLGTFLFLFMIDLGILGSIS
jgi:hypothetical protein